MLIKIFSYNFLVTRRTGTNLLVLFLSTCLHVISDDYFYNINAEKKKDFWCNSSVHSYRDRNTGIWDEVSVYVTGVSFDLMTGWLDLYPIPK